MNIESKKTFVRGMFDDIHGKYDFLNTVLSFGQDNRWRRLAIRDMPKDGLVLDLCSAGGEMAFQLFKRGDFGGEIILVDISRGMLSLSSKILEPKYKGRYAAVVCDAEKLPLKPDIFDGAVSAFCLRNLTDLGSFTLEVKRTLKPGTSASHLEIAHPPNKLLSTLFEFYFYKISPMMARLFTSRGYAYRYLPNSLKVFPQQIEVSKILGQSWGKYSYKNIMGGTAAIYTTTKMES